MPPIPASTESKSKLKAFTFYEDEKDLNSKENPGLESGVEKENHSPAEDSAEMSAPQLMPCPQNLSQRSTQKDCPQTPIGRLPLAELIAGSDDYAHQNLNLTPVERVLWNPSPASSQCTSSQDAPTIRNGKKRARSSSPAAASENKKSKPSPLLQGNLKTPQADPASDLWSRYSLKTAENSTTSPTGFKEDFLAKLMKSSSPQTPPSHLQARELRGLTRSISCANEWPASKTKRRRLNRSPSYNPASSELGPTEARLDGHERAKMSRVSLLVERIQEGIMKSHGAKEHSNRPTDSSSSEKARDVCVPAKGSVAQENDGRLSGSQDPTTSEAGSLLDSQKQRSEKSVGMSEFGEDEYDEEIMNTVDAGLAMNHLVATGTNEENDQKDTKTSNAISEIGFGSNYQEADLQLSSMQTCRETRQQSSSNLVAEDHETAQNPLAVEHDEFSDDDGEVSPADLETLVALYDQKPHYEASRGYSDKKGLLNLPQSSSKATTVQKSQTVSEELKLSEVVNVSSDEEFGEEPEFDDFFANCTQSTQTPSQNLSVRSKHPDL